MTSISDNEIRILAIVDKAGVLSAAKFNDACGNVRTVRSLFRKGLVEADQVPATAVNLTMAGLAALRARSALKSKPESK